MTPNMTMIVSEGKDREVYPGSVDMHVTRELPEYRGGVTMTIQCSPQQMQLAPVITVDPDISGGVPCIDERWPIAHILQELSTGITANQLAQRNPELTLAGIQLALEAASWAMRDPIIDWQSLDLPSMVDYQSEMSSWLSLSDDVLNSIGNDMED